MWVKVKDSLSSKRSSIHPLDFAIDGLKRGENTIVTRVLDIPPNDIDKIDKVRVRDVDFLDPKQNAQLLVPSRDFMLYVIDDLKNGATTRTAWRVDLEVSRARGAALKCPDWPTSPVFARLRVDESGGLTLVELPEGSDDFSACFAETLHNVTVGQAPQAWEVVIQLIPPALLND